MKLSVPALVNGPAAHGKEQARIWFNRAWLRVFQAKEEQGFETIGETNVIPVILPEDVDPKLFARTLMYDYGIWVAYPYLFYRLSLRLALRNRCAYYTFALIRLSNCGL